MMINIKRLNSTEALFRQQLDSLLAWESVADPKVLETVSRILNEVKHRGDAALLEYTQCFDHLNLTNAAELEIQPEKLQQALTGLNTEQRIALEVAACRIRDYAQHQRLESWSFTEADGTVLGQRIQPLDRVGLYVPGGRATYPSSVLMNAIPAKLAGVPELIMVVPASNGSVNPLVLAAAAIAGVDRVFTIGGAQAVAALTYGTQTIPAVDKIVGPGNIYVATAKRLVFGRVGIDMIAGPSEILVICDGKTDPKWIAMDLFSQAEHDVDSQAILLCPDKMFLDRVETALATMIESMERKAIIYESLNTRGALIEVQDLNEAVDVANIIAPEHLELSVDNPETLLDNIRHAGAIFMGRYTAEALGDYCAGPNHVLPTARTARFASPLGVYDFQKRSSLVQCSSAAASELGKTASILARGEGLTAHARSAELRINN